MHSTSEKCYAIACGSWFFTHVDYVAILCYTCQQKWMIMHTYARPVWDLRNNYVEILKLANEGNNVIITQNGREAAVVIRAKLYKEF